MPALTNPKHERFAQELAKGKTVAEAYTEARLEPVAFDAPAGCYVYLLVDPRNDRVFYVGKGTGNRALVHAQQAAKRSDLKSETIKAIRAGGRRTQVYVLADGLTRQAALRLERSIIVQAHRHLTNISLGEVDGVEREARAARENIAQIKPLCVMWRERAAPARMAVWVKVVSELARMTQKAA